MASIVRFEKPSSQPWSAKQVVGMIEKGSIVFDHRVQRPLVWDNKRNSLLISSIIMGMPLNGFYANRISETKVYEMLEGKQRLTAIKNFIDGTFKLRDVPPIEFDDGSKLDIEGKTFQELPEEIQNEILNYSISILRLDDLTEDQKEDVFLRINNGKPVSEIEKTKIKTVSKDEVYELSQHELFRKLIGKSGWANSANIDMVDKSFIVLYNYDAEKKSLGKDYVKQVMLTTPITEEQKQSILKVYDVVNNVINELIGKKRRDVVGKLKRKTVFYSILPTVLKSINESGVDQTTEKLIKWVEFFFGPEDKTSIDDEYNDLVGRGTTQSDKVNRRFEIVEDNFNQFGG